MAYKRPEKFDECVFYTRRATGEGKAEAFSLKANPEAVLVNYVCPKCKKEDSCEIPYEIKQVSVKNEAGKVKKLKAFVFSCEGCGEKIIIERWAKKRGPK